MRRPLLLACLALLLADCRKEQAPSPAPPPAAPPADPLPRRDGWADPTARPRGVQEPWGAEGTADGRSPQPVRYPCDRLGDEACRLFGEGSEECVETRARARRVAPDVGWPRCAEALTRLFQGALVPPGKSACVALTDLRCRELGDNTTGCRAARRALQQQKPDPRRDDSCLGDLLVREGLP